MTRLAIIVRKNRMRAFWAFVIVLFMGPISGWLLVTGLQPGRPDIAWAQAGQIRLETEGQL